MSPRTVIEEFREVDRVEIIKEPILGLTAEDLMMRTLGAIRKLPLIAPPVRPPTTRLSAAASPAGLKTSSEQFEDSAIAVIEKFMDARAIHKVCASAVDINLLTDDQGNFIPHTGFEGTANITSDHDTFRMVQAHSPCARSKKWSWTFLSGLTA